MTDSIIALTSIILLFVLLLIIKKKIPKPFCVLCASISLTWAGFLVASWLGIEIDKEIVGVLMGQSIIGIYYLVEKKVSEQWFIFRLPFLVTLTIGVWLILGYTPINITLLIFPALTWGVSGMLYLQRNKNIGKKIATRLIDCCKNW